MYRALEDVSLLKEMCDFQQNACDLFRVTEMCQHVMFLIYAEIYS